MDAEFTFTLKMEVELTYNPSSSIVSDWVTLDQIDIFFYISVRSNSSTLFTDIVYTIIEGKNTI